MRGVRRKSDCRRRRQERCLAGQVAVATVGMNLDHLVALIRQIGLRVVLMRVVAEMLRCFLPFMLAIRSRRCPAELER